MSKHTKQLDPCTHGEVIEVLREMASEYQEAIVTGDEINIGNMHDCPLCNAMGLLNDYPQRCLEGCPGVPEGWKEVDYSILSVPCTAHPIYKMLDCLEDEYDCIEDYSDRNANLEEAANWCIDMANEMESEC